jgi:hypothetical protein
MSPATSEPDRSAPFVISSDGQVYSDPTGKASDRELSGDAVAVLAAGRWVLDRGSLLVMTNESLAYHPSLEQMQAAVECLDSLGLDLTAYGVGVLVMVYATLDERGRGENGKRYRTRRTDRGIELVPLD